MSNQLLANGRYTIRPKDSQTTRVVTVGYPAILPNDEGPREDAWNVNYVDSPYVDSSYYTLSNAAGRYLGSEADPTAPTMALDGVSAPFPWEIKSAGEGVYTLSPRGSNGALLLSISPLKIYPPRVALLPAGQGPQHWRLTKI